MLEIRDGRNSGDTVSSLSAPGLVGNVCSVEGKLYDWLRMASATTKKVSRVYHKNCVNQETYFLYIDNNIPGVGGVTVMCSGESLGDAAVIS